MRIATRAALARPAAATGATRDSRRRGDVCATKVAPDPGVRAKLVELRRNLAEFQKASGGTEK